MEPDEVAELFEKQRRPLTGIAYRILGSWTEAEDLVQDLWPRWSSHAHAVESPQRWLRTVTVRAAIDQLRRLQQRRETYPGAWLPEPVTMQPDPAELAEQRDSISIGMLHVLETLSPLERAVFVLRQAFGWSPDEIAEALGRSAAAIRQLDHRARDHVAARRTRYDADEATAQAAAERFLEACVAGNVDDLMDILAPDVVLHSDGGGEAKAPLRAISDLRKVASFLIAISSTPLPDLQVSISYVNKRAAIVLGGPDGTANVMNLDVDQHGRITALYMIAAPSKLHHVAS